MADKKLISSFSGELKELGSVLLDDTLPASFLQGEHFAGEDVLTLASSLGLTLNLKEGAGSGATISADADLLVLDSDQTNRGLTLACAEGNNSNIYFAEGATSAAAKIQYIGSINALRLEIQGSRAFDIRTIKTTFNQERMDMDYEVYKLTSGVAYYYDAGADSHTWDGAIIKNIITTTSASHTVLASDYTILVDATAGNKTVNLPDAASNTGRILNIKKTDSSANTLTIDGNAADTIDNGLTAVLANENESITIQPIGTNWSII